MEQLIKGAIASGLTRSQAYELWQRATELKKLKVFKQLMLLSPKQITWSDLESLIRRYQLSEDQYRAIKARYYQYSWG